MLKYRIIIIIPLSEWIKFNFDWALNTIELLIRVTFYYVFITYLLRENAKGHTLVIEKILYIKRLNYLVNRINWKLEEAIIQISTDWQKNYKRMWIGIPILLPHRFHKVLQEVRCLILASSQRKLHEYIKFL